MTLEAQHPSDHAVALELVRRLVAAGDGRIRRVIMYGSRAGGTATEDSDFDLLIVFADPVLKREEAARLRDLLGEVPYAIDVWVMGEREFEETKEVIGGLAYPAHKYGLVLHENA